MQHNGAWTRKITKTLAKARCKQEEHERLVSDSATKWRFAYDVQRHQKRKSRETANDGEQYNATSTVEEFVQSGQFYIGTKNPRYSRQPDEDVYSEEEIIALFGTTKVMEHEGTLAHEYVDSELKSQCVELEDQLVTCIVTKGESV